MHRHVYITSAHPAQAVKGTDDYAAGLHRKQPSARKI